MFQRVEFSCFQSTVLSEDVGHSLPVLGTRVVMLNLQPEGRRFDEGIQLWSGAVQEVLGRFRLGEVRRYERGRLTAPARHPEDVSFVHRCGCLLSESSSRSAENDVAV